MKLPAGSKGLDVGCVRGALAIACAKRNADTAFTGIDRRGKEYASFSQALLLETLRVLKKAAHS